MKYPGLTYIGSGEIAGLYGLNETIHDQKSYGLQHLYLDNYEVDYIYSALSVVEFHNTCYYADHSKPKSGHPQKAKSKTTYSKDGFRFIDEFEYHHFQKMDSAYCANDRLLIFNTTIENKTDQVLAMKVSSFVVTTKLEFECSGKGDQILLEAKGKKIRLLTQEKDVLVRVSKESPSGFMYKGIQNLMYEENQFVDESLRGNEGFVITQTVSIHLEPKQSYTFQWALSMEEKEVDFLKIESQAKSYWKQWLKKSPYEIPDTVIANLIALKAICLKGFIPADLTGHYFAGDQVSFYVRDALHGARAFLYSGFYEESKEIILITKELARKKNHEMFQRYNSKLIPDEGANNNVFSQIDVIGYLLRIVGDYEKITGDLVMDVESLIKEMEVLDDVNMKNGLYGPEGGVNEGVYGPAFITSTNIFIVGGLLGMLEILRVRKHPKRLKVQTRIREMQKAIEETFLEEGYFAYGYVEYAEELVKRYDTPQLFGASLGYPLSAKYRKNFETLSKIACYFDYGYGYSEQQYHDGPWVFNTAFAAQNAYLFHEMPLYHAIMRWLEEHKNGYGLLPEAIDAWDEEKSFINPLMWANAEYICANFVEVISELRGE